MKRSIILLFLLMGCICLMFAACGSGETEDAEQETVLQDCPLVYEEDSAGVPLDISIEDFNAVGFDYGDSVDLAFSNGYSMEDIPYYSGYYVDAYEPLLVAYPGTEHVKATINYGEDLWVEAGLSEGDTVTVSLREAGKYLEIQEAMDLRYTNDRDDYASDEVFANFRNVTAGNIKENVLYRSASPCNNKYNRAPYADKLEAEAGVRCIVNMADNDKDIQGYIAADDFDSPYFLERYQNNDVLALNMSMNYLADVFR